MTVCTACGHPRLVHDSWGCKMGCSCAVSIIYLTALLPSQSDRSTENEAIDLGNRLVRQADSEERSRLEELYGRTILEQTTAPVPTELLE